MKRNVLAVGLVVVCSVAVLAQAPAAGTKTDPIIGTWKINAEKSNPKPAPGTVSGLQYELRPDGFIVRNASAVTAQGNPTFGQTTYKYDGKDYPRYGQDTLADFTAKGVKPGTDAYRTVDAYTTEITQKDSAGKVGTKITRVVSKDGKVLTITTKGTNAKGQTVNTIAVYDRVK